MRIGRRPFRSAPVFLLALLALLASGPVLAQATRTWISGVGDDVNPCSRTAPCKTFAGAISKTAAGGIINVLDPGGFGAVTITKSITLEAVGFEAGIVVAGTNGIVVNDPSDSAVVTLRGLQLEGLGLSSATPGINGVNFLKGKGLIVERCNIDNFTSTAGINFNPFSSARLVVRDSTIRNSGDSASPGSSGSVVLRPQSGRSDVLLDNVHIVDGPGSGLLADGSTGTIQAVVRNSAVSGFSGNGVWAQGGANAVNLTLDDVVVSGNEQAGLLAQGNGAQIRTADSTITGNAVGMQSSGGGAVVSFGTNRNHGNLVNGAPNSTVAQQ